MTARIMYIERKAGRLTGEARIGRVTFSKTGRTIYCKGKAFRRLCGERVPIEIDNDVREEYRTVIRQMPENRGKRQT